jgi:hypothetical protein
VPEGPPYLHVIQVCADPDDFIQEVREDNNCATRSIIAGAAPDLFVECEDIWASESQSPPGRTITLGARIRNRGGEDGIGLVVFEYVDDLGWRRPIAEIPVFVEKAGASYGVQWVYTPWEVALDSTMLHVTITDVSPPEFNELNNHVETAYPWDLGPSPVIFTGLEAVSSEVGIILEWSASGDVLGFVIERRDGFDWDRLTPVPIVSDVSPGLSRYRFLDETAAADRQYEYRILGLGRDGTYEVLGVVSVHFERAVPSDYRMSRSHPNPFSGLTYIQLAMPHDEEVSVRVYSVTGQLVAELWDGRLEAGYHSIRWNGTGRDGKPVAPGMYYCRMSAGRFEQTRRMLLLK